MKKYIILLIITITLFATGCSNVGNNKKEIDPNSAQVTNMTYTYEDFVKNVNIFRENFKPNDFTVAVPDGSLGKFIVSFPEDIKLDKRTNDGINGDTAKPSKYVLYYLNDDKTALVKLNFVYAKIENTGIILQSIVSPADNIGLDEKYKTFKRPFYITKILSLKNYMIVIEYSLLEPEKLNVDDNEKIMKLIGIDNNFYKKIESYFVSQGEEKK